jgi:hypothetical protein
MNTIDRDNNVSCGKARPVCEVDLTAIVSRLSRRCGILNISQLSMLPQPLTGGTALHFVCKRCSYLSANTYGCPRPVTGQIYCLIVDDIRGSQETSLWASTPCYKDSFTFIYVDDAHTSQETRLWASTACYGDSFTFAYVDDAHT